MATRSYCDGMRQQTTILGTGIYPPSCMWAAIFGYDSPTLAVPGSPPQSVWTVPPVSGADAQQTVNALVDQQLIDQQAINSVNVQSTWLDRLLGTGGSIANNLPSASSLMYLVLGVVAVALIIPMTSDGGPRRYGR